MIATLSSEPALSATAPDLEPLGKLLAKLPGGRPSGPTQWRWVYRGVNGIKLPALRVGGRWYSTKTCVDWFISERTRQEINRSEQAAACDFTDDDLASVGLLS